MRLEPNLEVWLVNDRRPRDVRARDVIRHAEAARRPDRRSIGRAIGRRFAEIADWLAADPILERAGANLEERRCRVDLRGRGR
jgi:hypothetical protein